MTSSSRTATTAHLTSLEIAGDTASFPDHAELVRTLIVAAGGGAE